MNLFLKRQELHGEDYPKPIASIEESRDIALKAYDKLKDKLNY